MNEVANTWRSVARTDPGKVRSRNEDAFLALPERGLWAVADGMGGHRNGDLASRLIVEELAELPDEGDLQQRVQRLRQTLHRLNRQMSQQLTVTAERPDTMMGSTVVTLVVHENRAACIWAGDSRCYLWRRSCLYQLSKDHSMAQQLIDEQKMTPEEAAKHPSARALTRAIGVGDDLQLDILELDVLPGDVFLLCSDGLYQGLSINRISQALNRPLKQSINRLFQHALDTPARDNITAVVVRR